MELHGALMKLFYKNAEKIEESMAMFVGGYSLEALDICLMERVGVTHPVWRC